MTRKIVSAVLAVVVVAAVGGCVTGYSISRLAISDDCADMNQVSGSAGVELTYAAGTGQ